MTELQNPELPPLPEPTDHRYLVLDWKGREVYEGHVPAGQKPIATQALFAEEDMRSYGELCWNACLLAVASAIRSTS